MDDNDVFRPQMRKKPSGLPLQLLKNASVRQAQP
jgi:hypothetical protein